MKFEHTKVEGFEPAVRGMRNALASWAKSDSHYGDFGKYIIGENDIDLAQRLIKAGSPDRKFMRQIQVWVDITAPEYWWSQYDTYKVATVANSTSKMHKLASTPITKSCFELDDYDGALETDDACVGIETEIFLNFLENLRQKYLETKNKRYWKELVRWLPEGWLQTRTVSLNYETLRSMYFQRRHHKLTEWHSFCAWVETLPYAHELILYTGEEEN